MGTGRHGRLPLSSAQEGIWLAHGNDPTARRYTCAECLTLDGPLDTVALRQAWALLCAEADTLRVARFVDEPHGGLYQLITDRVPPLRELDLRAEPDAEAAALAYLHNDLDAPLDLATGPVSLAVLLRTADDRHLLYLRMHHIVTDGYSMHLLHTTLADLYTSIAARQPRSTTPLRALTTLIERDAKYRAGEDFKLDHAYWTKRFADHPEPMRLPGVRAEQSAGGRPIRDQAELPTADVDVFAATATALGTSWQVAVIGATAAYLQRATGRRDVVLGLASNARRGITANRTPGMAANTLPLRVAVAPSMSLRGLLPSVAAEVAHAQRHERYRYDDLLRTLRVPVAEEGPLGPIINFMPYPRRYGFGDITANAVNLSAGPLPDISFGLTGTAGDGLTASVDANAALHRADKLPATLRRWTEFLRTVTRNPDRPLHTIDLLTAGERVELLVRRNETGRERAANTVVDLIHEVVRQHPDRVALAGNGIQLTYAELDARSARLAARLTERGVQREDVVGLAMARSPHLIVAMLAVLRAGGCYLPLDLGYPPDRIRRMVDDSAPRCVVVSDAAAAAAVLPTTSLLVDVTEQPAGPPAPATIDPDGAANIIYTSGSTGSPKGVLTHHRGLANLALDHSARFGLDPDSSMLQYVSPAFDAASGDIWPALVAGARLVLARDPTDVSTTDLLALLRNERITHVALPPSMLRQLSADGLPDLRNLVVGGESTDANVVERWAPGRRMLNMYGPTEACCAATGARVVPGEPLTIGEPIENVAVYVLDADLQPVAPGAAGELYVAGAGVARGYLNQPGLTADKFLPCPFGPPGARMYRTGDRVHQDDEGVLRYLGRADHQVKIRGHRVELGEIEAALGADPAVGNAIVMATAAQSGTKRLVGYVVPRDAAVVDLDGLRARVRAVLPEYMVPSSIVVIDTFPLQPNGKVDRNALPEPDQPRAVIDDQGPVTEEQATLCKLFAEVLGVPEIGVRDSFFEHGGDSILALRLVSAARAAGMDVNSRQVFEHPTVAELAEIASLLATETGDAEPDDSTGSFPAPPIVRWALELGSVDQFHQSMCVRVPAGAGLDRLAAVLRLVIDRHPALRTRLVDDRTLHVAAQGHVHDVLTTVDVSGFSADAVAAVIERQRADAAATLRPAEGRVLRAVWLDAGADAPGVLVLVLHHLAVDGVSWRILLPDLAHAWAVVTGNDSAPFSPLGTSPRAWSTRLAEAAIEPHWTAQVELWQRILRSGSPAIGTRDPSPGIDTFATAATTGITLPVEVTDALLTVLPDRYRATQDDILLTGLALAVRHHAAANGSTVLVDLEGHGRHGAGRAVALENSVGWFTSIHPVAVDPGPVTWSTVESGEAGLGAAVKRVKEQLRAIPDHGIGFGLARYLNEATASELAALGTPRLAFNYLGKLAAGAGADWSPAGNDPFAGTADPRMTMPHALEINAIAYDRADGTHLELRAMWPSGVLAESAVTELLDALRTALTGLAAHARVPGVGGLTPSDVPLADLDQDDIDEITERRPDTTDILPLTPLQEALLLHNLITVDAVDAYNDQIRLVFDGPLDAARMRGALATVLRRHPTLAAAFEHDVAVPVQVLGGASDVPWTEHDLTHLDDAELNLRADRLATADRMARFALGDPPAMRCRLIKRAADRHELVLTTHHIVWDGWSMAIVLRELFTCYAQGDDRTLTVPPRYRTYLNWLSEQDVSAGTVAWAQYLSGLPGPTVYAPGLPSTTLVTHDLLTAELLEENSAALVERARESGVTLNTLVQLVWAVLLNQLTEADDVVFGTSVSGRPADLPGVDRMVGLLTNTVPVRVRLTRDASVADAVTALSREQVPLLNHHHVGLATIQRQTGQDRTELFDTTVMVLNYPFDPAEWDAVLGDLRVSDYALSDGTPYPLRMVVVPGQRTQVRLGFRPDAVDRADAQCLLDRAVSVFSAVANDTDQTVSDLIAVASAAGRSPEGTI